MYFLKHLPRLFRGNRVRLAYMVERLIDQRPLPLDFTRRLTQLLVSLFYIIFLLERPLQQNNLRLTRDLL